MSKSPRYRYEPPKLATRFLRWYCRAELVDEVEGDLFELFQRRVQEQGLWKAKMLYWLNIFMFVHPDYIRKRSVPYPSNYTDMLENFTLIAYRNFTKKKGYTFINIMGLATGLASSFLIFLWIQDEYQMDRFHANESRLYQVMKNDRYADGQVRTSRVVPTPLAQFLEENFAEVKEAEPERWGIEILISHGKEEYREEGTFVGEDYFLIFSYPFVEGDPATALENPGSIVISETLAHKLFGDQSAIGESLRIDDQVDAIVTGVFRDIPSQSSIQFSFAVPIKKYIQRNEWTESWGNSGMRLFVLLEPQADVVELNEKIRNLIKEHEPEDTGELFLTPFADQYLYSEYENGEQAGGRITYLRIFMVVAVFMLVIACINYMNLSTARSSQRAKEVGIRKAIGANKKYIVWQFLLESSLIAVLALLLALLMVELILPYFNELTDKSMTVDYGNPLLLMGIVGILLLTGLFAGSYPALFLASFEPNKVLKGSLHRSRGAALFRKSLVVFQFTVSGLLIVGTVVVYKQIHYILSKNLGLEKENLVYLHKEGTLTEKYESFKEQLSKQPGIKSITVSGENPLDVGRATSGVKWIGKQENDDKEFMVMATGYDFTQTMGMRLLSGRDFSPAFSTDTANYIINETAVRYMALDKPVGADLNLWGHEGKVIGVVEDFHSASLYDDIEPLVIYLSESEASYIFVRTDAGKTVEALASIEEVSKDINPAYPFTYHFLDQTFKESYRKEQVISILATLFTSMAIFVSCLGLLGLASYTAEQRTKEIGVRKIMGASVSGIVLLLSSDFTKLVIIGFFIASPLAYILMRYWLQNFAYQTELNLAIFVLSGLATLFISWLTVGYQSIKAAIANPVDSLRNE